MTDKYFAIRNSRMASRLTEVTRFSRVEIVALLRIYQQIEEVYGMSIKKPVFVEIMANLFDISDELIASNVFLIANFSASGSLTEEEWIFLMEIFLIGKFEERVRFAFSVYDIERCGELNRGVLGEFVARGVRTVMVGSFGDDLDNTVKDIVDVMVAVFDLNRDNVISYTEFKEVCQQEPLYMEVIGRCLPDQRHVLAMLSLFEGREKHQVFYYTKNEKSNELPMKT